MDKKLNGKSSNFFKKEGFYVVLFVCLCIVATVAAVSIRNNKAKEKPPVAQNSVTKPNTDLAINTSNGKSTTNTTQSKTEVPNALEVNKTTTPSPAITVPKTGATAVVAQAVDTKFIKPVDGTLARPYSTDTVYCQTIGTYKTNNGVDIVAKLGSPVYAVLDGKIEAIDNDGTELGQYIVISHSNGLKTVYSNLDTNLTVKVGDSVKKGAIIGKVGKTRESYSDEKYGDHLHFEVMKGNDYLDPTKYVSYSVASNSNQ